MAVVAAEAATAAAVKEASSVMVPFVKSNR